jgi:cell division protein WhiA
MDELTETRPRRGRRAGATALSQDVRHELAAISPKRECCRLAELSALFHTAGSLHLRGRGEVAVHLDLSSSAAARRAFALLRGFRVDSEVRTYRRRAFEQATRYQLHVSGQRAAIELLRRAGVLGPRLAPLERPPRRVVGRSCCRGAYLRGALLGAGSVSGPPSPHLELRTSGLEGATFLAAVAAADDVPLFVHDRGRHAVAYCKGIEPIAGLLAVAGASDTALAFEERAVLAATRARANRLANADHANLVRTSVAAGRQLAAIRALERNGRLGKLPVALRGAADLRVTHPSLGLADLARKARPPISKSAIARRLDRLVRLAEDA